MLAEHKTRQVNDEPLRRWFCDEIFDLLVWFDEKGTPIGFQLCYETERQELALVWKKDSGFSNFKVDSGEDSPEKNLSPLLVKDGVFPTEEVIHVFKVRSVEIEPKVRDLVLEKLKLKLQ